MKKRMILTSLFACIGFSAQAQESKNEETKSKVIFQVFGNFHTGFAAQNDVRGFELDRVYLGYEHNLGKGLSLKGVIDMGAKTDDYERIAYIKYAQVCWKKGDWTLNGGLISTNQFHLLEKFWGYRYIYKSFLDQYKFGSSADLGISVAYKPAKWISLDAIVANGEGYKKIQYKDGLLYGLGATFTPAKRWTLRAYAEINEQPEAKHVINYTVFAGYKHDIGSIGAECNYMQNNKGIENHDKSGLSVYGTIKINRWSEIYARYDYLTSKNDWALTTDEGVLLVGTQFKLSKYVKIAPNFRITMPEEDRGKAYSAYLNCYFGF